MVVITDYMDMSLSKLQKLVNREGWHVLFVPHAVHGVTKSQTQPRD